MKPWLLSGLDACRARYRNFDRRAHHHRYSSGVNLKGLAYKKRFELVTSEWQLDRFPGIQSYAVSSSR